MAGKLREGRYSLWQRSPLAHDQLVLADVEGLLLADLIKILGPEYRNRILAVVFLLEGGLDEGTLDAESSRSVKALLMEALDTVVHTAVILWVFDREIHISVIITQFLFLASSTSSMVIGFFMVPSSLGPFSVIT